MISAYKKYLLGAFSWKRVFRSLAEIYLLVMLVAVFFSDHLIFRPPPPSYTEGGNSCLIPVNSEESIGFSMHMQTNAPYTVLYVHGNAEDLGDIQFILDAYHAHGFSAASFDYRGYGISQGKAGTRNACEDGEAALRYLTDVMNIPVNSIILHGRSVGAGTAVYLASQFDTAGLIVESAFVSAFRTLTRIPMLPFDKMKIRAGVLHGVDVLPLEFIRYSSFPTYCKMLSSTTFSSANLSISL